jgi:small subunit ribosomal protein S15
MPRIKKSVVDAENNGSATAQISALTAEIVKLTGHLKANPKDYSSRRGLLKKVGRRKSLLRYLMSTDVDLYKAAIEANGLKLSQAII